MFDIPYIRAIQDDDVLDICNWGRQVNLSQFALLVFMTRRDIPPTDPWNETVNIYRQQKTLLLSPLLEVDQLLETPEHWERFALHLIKSGINGSRISAENARKKLRQADEIKNKILKKTKEIVMLAGELEKLDSYVDAVCGTKFIYPELLLKAAEIHNEQYFGIDNHGLPGVFVGAEKNDRMALHKRIDSQSIKELREMGDDCSYQDEVEKQLKKRLDTTLGDNPMPSIEALILAYGKFIQEVDSHDVGLKFSKRCSPGDFIREFTGNLLMEVTFGFLPDKIKSLSFSSIQTFAKVFYPHTIIKAGNYIDANWTRKKDSTFD